MFPSADPQEYEELQTSFRRERVEWQQTAAQVQTEMEKMQTAHTRVRTAVAQWAFLERPQCPMPSTSSD